MNATKTMTAKEINKQTTNFFYENNFTRKEGDYTFKVSAISIKKVWYNVFQYGSMIDSETSENMNMTFQVIPLAS